MNIKERIGLKEGFFLSENQSRPAARVPPNAILLPGSKSKQKYHHLAVGMCTPMVLALIGNDSKISRFCFFAAIGGGA
ncbi:MAG: hypothetical protein KAU27_08290 [Desulfuromonadales bacterium]|nr:hypothetical protein [Desulfuromonadales bacterium]